MTGLWYASWARGICFKHRGLQLPKSLSKREISAMPCLLNCGQACWPKILSTEAPKQNEVLFSNRPVRPRRMPIPSRYNVEQSYNKLHWRQILQSGSQLFPGPPRRANKDTAFVGRSVTFPALKAAIELRYWGRVLDELDVHSYSKNCRLDSRASVI